MKGNDIKTVSTTGSDYSKVPIIHTGMYASWHYILCTAKIDQCSVRTIIEALEYWAAYVGGAKIKKDGPKWQTRTDVITH